MRAAVLEQYNAPWIIKELSDPTPSAGQVVIRVRASGVCGGDLHLYHGMFSVPPPIIGGHEPVGEIVAVGAGVTTLQVGDRVGVSWMQRGCGRCERCLSRRSCQREQHTWMQLGGGNSELMLAWAEGCTLLPDGLSFEEAAPVFCAGYTVMSGLRAGAPQPGERVAILGIGGLGHLAVQYARALGLETIAITSSADKQAEAKRMGADEVVLGGGDPGQALQAVGGADVILSTVDSAVSVERVIFGLRPEGRLVSVGLPEKPVSINIGQLLLSRPRLIVATQGERRDLVEALRLVATGKVKPMLECYPLEQVNQVLERLAAGKVRYRAVLQHGNR